MIRLNGWESLWLIYGGLLVEFRFRLACSVIKEKVEARSGFVLRGGTSVRCNEKLIPQFILLVTLPRREGWTVVIS